MSELTDRCEQIAASITEDHVTDEALLLAGALLRTARRRWRYGDSK